MLILGALIVAVLSFTDVPEWAFWTFIAVWPVLWAIWTWLKIWAVKRTES